jgi:hypothetical protein
MVGFISIVTKFTDLEQVMGGNLKYKAKCPCCGARIEIEQVRKNIEIACEASCSVESILDKLGVLPSDLSCRIATRNSRKANHDATADVTSQIFCGEGRHLKLLPHHYKQLQASGLSDETIEAAGIHSETNVQRAAHLLGWRSAPKRTCPAIVIPYPGREGPSDYYRLKPDLPRKDRNQKDIKYESPKGRANRPYYPPKTLAAIDDPLQELLITEGEKKALAADQHGFPCIGLVGCHGWKEKNHERLILELEQIEWQGRTVYLAFDSDLSIKEDVQKAEAQLAKHLMDRGGCGHRGDHRSMAH